MWKFHEDLGDDMTSADCGDFPYFLSVRYRRARMGVAWLQSSAFFPSSCNILSSLTPKAIAFRRLSSNIWNGVYKDAVFLFAWNAIASDPDYLPDAWNWEFSNPCWIPIIGEYLNCSWRLNISRLITMVLEPAVVDEWFKTRRFSPASDCY